MVAIGRNGVCHVLGLTLGSANTLRHRALGYTRPRPFSADDVRRGVDHVFTVVDRLERRGELDFRRKRVLELGPGPDLGTGAIISARGAAGYDAVDAFDLRAQTDDRFYAELEKRLGTVVDRTRLQFTTSHFPALRNVSGPYAAVVSNATLEHISAIPDLFRRLHELMVRGGRMVHHVDAQTHMRGVRERDPLNILRFSEPVYRGLLSFPGAPNRLRAGDYLDAFREAGFAEAWIAGGKRVSRRYVARVEPGLARRFRGREDLDLVSFTLVAVA